MSVLEILALVGVGVLAGVLAGGALCWLRAGRRRPPDDVDDQWRRR